MISDRALERVLPPTVVALAGDVVRVLLWLALALAWVFCGSVYLRLGRLLAESRSTDFTIFYYTARLLADGRPMYGDLPSEYGLTWPASYLGNLNAPHFQIVLLPLIPFGYERALIVWILMNALCAAASVWIIARELRPAVTPKRAAVAGAAVLASAAWTSLAVTGEMSLLLLLPFTLAWAAARRGRWTQAGAWLGIVASVKLFAFLFLPWLVLRRRWHAVFAFVLAVAAVVSCGALAFGIGAYVDWIHLLQRVAWWWPSMNASLRGMVERWFNPADTFTPLARSPMLAHVLWMTGAFVVGSITTWRLWKKGEPEARPVSIDREILLLVVTALLLSPLGWVYYLVLATPPILGLLAGGGLRGRGWSIWFAALAVLLFYIPPQRTEAGQPSVLATITLGSAYGWATIMLWVSVVMKIGANESSAIACRAHRP